MAKVSRPSRLQAIADTLIGIRKGRQPTPAQQSELDWFTRIIRLDRPIETYAARTQRRYIAGAGRGFNAERTRTEDRAQRTRARTRMGPYTPAQWKRVVQLRNRIRQLGVDVDPYQEDYMLRDFGMIYGPDYVIQFLEDQIEATEAYAIGDRTLGAARWEAHERFDQAFRASNYYLPRGSDPYFYYHGRR